jgi:glycine/D-amino acid oxidase-like deaminating enzyme
MQTSDAPSTTITLWEASAPPPPSTPTLEGLIQADTLIIGAGYAGLSAALHLAEAGRSVAVLEAFDIGHGGAGRNNGMVIPALSRAYPADLRARFGEHRGNRFALLAGRSANETFDLIRRHGIDCDAVQNGWLQPAHTPGRAQQVLDRYQQWHALGADVAYLDRAQTTTLTGSPLYHGAWLARSGGHVNPLKLVQGLARAAIAAGARIYTRSPAIALTSTRDGWSVDTPRGAVKAATVIVATDAYADKLLPQVQRAIIPVSFFQLATRPLSGEEAQGALPGGHALSDTHADMYFARPTADGRLVSGGALVLQHDWHNRLQAHVRERLRRMFPTLDPAIAFSHAWQGKVAMTTDFLPHLHEVAPGLITVTGFNGRGVALATATGRVLAQAAQGHSVDDLDIPLTPLRPVPLHGLVKRVAPLELLRYRWRDSREART